MTRRTVAVGAAFLALWNAFFFVVPSDAVEIKLRAPATRQEPKEASEQSVKTPNAPSRQDAAGTSQDDGSKTAPKKDDVDVAPPESVPRSDATAAAASEDNSSSKELQSVEKPKKAVAEKKEVRRAAPLTADEWEKRYPKNQDAVRMTVETLIPSKKLRNVRVLRIFTRVPRSEFLPRKQRDVAYNDVEIPLDGDFHEPRPFDVAFSIEALTPQETDRVLVVDAGSGYAAALLSGLVAEVYAVGADRSATKRAADACKKLRYSNVYFQSGDPLEGRSDEAPFDKILVTRGIGEFPTSLLDQLKEGGKIVAPVGDRYRQIFILGEKKGEGLEQTSLIPTRLEMMKEETAPRASGVPAIIGGGFEELDPEPPQTDAERVETADESDADSRENVAALPPEVATPVGWYDAWNFHARDSADSFEGAKVCRFSNVAIALNHAKQDRNEERIRAATLPEERAEKTETSEAIKANQRRRELRSQMSQSFAIDGAAVKKIVVSGAYRAATLESQQGKASAELVRIEFFDKARKSLGASAVVEVSLTPSGWNEFSNEVSVPARAKEATITVGLLDAIGTVEFDALEARDKFEKERRNR